MSDLKIVPTMEATEGVAQDDAMKRAFDAMASERVEAGPALEFEARGIATIARQMERERRRRTQSWAIGGALLVAAGALLALQLGPTDEMVASSTLVPESTLGKVEIRHGAEAPWGRLGESNPLEAGTTVRTSARGAATLKVGDAISIILAGETRIQFGAASGAAVDVSGGTATFQIAPRLSGEPFTVRSARSTVVVRGTKFSVTFLEEGAAACVVVQEGSVEVTDPGGKARVGAGQERGCVDTAPKEPKSQTEVVDTKLDRAEPSVRAPARVPAPKTSKESSDLAEQNRIFQQALISERAGDRNGARQHLDLLLRKYPDSPLAAQARAQRKALDSRP